MMRRGWGTLWVLGLAGSLAAAGGAAPVVRVQTASQSAHDSSVSVSIAPSCAGDLIVVGVMSTHGGPPPLVVTDNAPGGSNEYKLAAYVFGPNHQYLFYAEGAKGGVTRVTAAGAYSALDLIVAEYAGVAASDALDRAAARNNGYSADSHWRTGWTAPIRSAPQLLVAIGGGTYYAPSFVHRAGHDFQFVATHAEGGHYVSGLMMEDRIAPTVGAYEATGYSAMAGGGKDVRYGILATFRLEPSALARRCDPAAAAGSSD
jgi:hypothetical protein